MPRHKKPSARRGGPFFLLYALVLLIPAAFMAHFLMPGAEVILPDTGTPVPADAYAATAAPTPYPATPSPSPTPTPKLLGSREITLRAVGDLMAHEKQLEAAHSAQGYDFTDCFASITPLLQAADVTIGNLETTIAQDNFSGYPNFRTPQSYVSALSQAGFSVLTLANNHTWDAGAKGVEHTVQALRDHNIHSTGAFITQEDSQNLLLLDVEGVRIGIIAYTAQRNHVHSPEWAVNFSETAAPIARNIEQAREQGADIVLVMMHWGREGTSQVHPSQQKMAQALARAGADVVLGAHPHVIQSAQWLEVEDEAGVSKRCFVAYSMGNFLSNQRFSDPPHDAGVIFDIKIEKNLDTGESAVSQVSCIPTWVRKNRNGNKYVYDVLPIERALKETQGLSESEIRRLNRVWKATTQTLSEVPTLYE